MAAKRPVFLKNTSQWLLFIFGNICPKYVLQNSQTIVADIIWALKKVSFGNSHRPKDKILEKCF